MLEDFFVDSTAAQRLRSCVIGAHLDAFCAWLADLGYRPPTIRHKLWIVSSLSRWMTAECPSIGDLNERRVEEFVAARRGRGRTCRGFCQTLLQLLKLLRSTGEVRMPESVRDESPAAKLLARYEGHLRRERALVESTIVGYRRFVCAFIAEHLTEGLAQSDSLCGRKVRDFLLARVGRMDPKRAQYMGTALRSFLRFLFLRGETEVDLALAVPTVRQWRLSGVPRYLPAEEVERLLRSGDRSSPTGRRNYAILLLLARLGLRAGEVVGLEIGDLRWLEGEIIVRGKGKVHDRLPLLSDVGEAIALYLRKDRPACRSRRVFLCLRAPHRGFSHPSTVTTIVTRALARAGIAAPTRGAHLLRHSLATTMVRRGASLAEIGQVLRHRSASTTEIYAKLDFGALREVALPWPTAPPAGGAR
ncbi:site-specific integrase [Planctomycetota bacterium]